MKSFYAKDLQKDKCYAFEDIEDKFYFFKVANVETVTLDYSCYHQEFYEDVTCITMKPFIEIKIKTGKKEIKKSITIRPEYVQSYSPMKEFVEIKQEVIDQLITNKNDVFNYAKNSIKTKNP